jgi:hypothetical protein
MRLCIKMEVDYAFHQLISEAELSFGREQLRDYHEVLFLSNGASWENILVAV